MSRATSSSCSVAQLRQVGRFLLGCAGRWKEVACTGGVQRLPQGFHVRQHLGPSLFPFPYLFHYRAGLSRPCNLITNLATTGCLGRASYFGATCSTPLGKNDEKGSGDRGTRDWCQISRQDIIDCICINEHPASFLVV